MKAKVNLDKRTDFDKKWDKMWNEMVRNANLNPRQGAIVGHYLRSLLTMRMHEIESACDMAWLIALIESEKFGTDVSKGAKKLIRVQQYAVNVRNEAYGNNCIDANGDIDYDGCGLGHLQVRLQRHRVEYETGV